MFTVVSITSADHKSVTVKSVDGIGSEYYHNIERDFVDSWFYVDNCGYSHRFIIREGTKYEITNKFKGLIFVKFVNE